MTNPFPEEGIQEFVAKTNPRNRYLFALLNAQRAVVIADDAVGGLDATDRELIDAAVESCWAVAGSAVSAESLRKYAEPLDERMVSDHEPHYTEYNSSVNSALAGVAYTIMVCENSDALSAYDSAISMFDLADYLLQRNYEGSGYIRDLASAPITALAAQSIVEDIDDLTRGDVDLGDLRERAVGEGHRIAALERRTVQLSSPVVAARSQSHRTRSHRSRSS